MQSRDELKPSQLTQGPVVERCSTAVDWSWCLCSIDGSVISCGQIGHHATLWYIATPAYPAAGSAGFEYTRVASFNEWVDIVHCTVYVLIVFCLE